MEAPDNLKDLYAEIKKYVGLQAEYFKVEFVEKMTILLSTLLIIVLVINLAVAALFYAFFALAYALEPVVGGLILSFIMVSAVFVLLIVLLFVFRKKLIINPMVRFLSTLFLDKSRNQ